MNKYLNTRNTSLEDSVMRVLQGLSERVEYVEYDFKSRSDAMKAKRMLDAVQLMNFDINDDGISRGMLTVDAGNKDMTKYHQQIMKMYKPRVITQEKLVGGQKKLDKDKDGDIDGKDFAMLRKDKAKKEQKEAYEIGTPEYTKHTLEVTPGQNTNDVDEMLGIAQKKNLSMRETLAKMWGMTESKNPFEKKVNEKENEMVKKVTKTMTGKKPTPVEVNPKTGE